MQKKKAEAEKAKIIIFKLEKNWTRKFLFFCYPSRIKILSAHCFNHIDVFNAIQGKTLKHEQLMLMVHFGV